MDWACSLLLYRIEIVGLQKQQPLLLILGDFQNFPSETKKSDQQNSLGDYRHQEGSLYSIYQLGYNEREALARHEDR